MHTFIVTLHVLSAVLIMGPLVLAVVNGQLAVRRHDAAGTGAAARQMAGFSTGSLLVAVLGAGAASTSDKVSFRTPWVIISITLYVVMVALAFGYVIPALRRAAKLLDEGVLARPTLPTSTDDDDDETPAVPAPISATATELVTKERLDHLAGRIASSGTLVALTIIAITVLMTTRPFGD